MNPPQQVNHFLGAMGELLQRMSDPAATYGLALPDSPQYRGLVARLPALAWQRLHLAVLFVSKDADGKYTVRRLTTPSQTCDLTAVPALANRRSGSNRTAS